MIPTHQTKGSAGADLCAAEDVTIKAMETVAVKTGAYVPESMPKGAWLGLYARSSLAAKGLITSIGVIDADYKGEIKVVLTNLSGTHYKIIKGERIGQLIPQYYMQNVFPVHDVKRVGGFGSTNYTDNTTEFGEDVR